MSVYIYAFKKQKGLAAERKVVFLYYPGSCALQEGGGEWFFESNWAMRPVFHVTLDKMLYSDCNLLFASVMGQ